jgi:hypothetical protein
MPEPLPWQSIADAWRYWGKPSTRATVAGATDQTTFGQMPDQTMAGFGPWQQAPTFPSPVEQMDPFERAALRTKESVRPSAGRAFSPGQEAALNTLVPQSPLDIAFMLAGAPGLRAGARALSAGAAMAMQPSEAEAGPVAAIRRLLNPIRAYHGSPYDFERFDMSKIGTGEGAQAYGHGLYFAENKGVAADYRKRLAPGNPANVTPDEEAVAAIKPKWDEISTKLRAVREASGERMTPESSALQNHLDALYDHAMQDTLDRKPWLTQGRMYEVNIHAQPEQFLDWDKPLAQQAPEVQQIAAHWPKATGEEIYRGLSRAVTQDPTNPLWRFGTRNPDVATEYLREAGIPGIKYLDQGSRHIDLHAMKEGDKFFAVNPDKVKQSEAFNSREDAWRWINAEKERTQTSNYVLFRDDIIDIVKKYGWAGLAAMTGINPDNLPVPQQNAPQLAQ